MNIHSALLCPVVLIISAVCSNPEYGLRGIDAGACKLKWENQMQFVFRKGWSQQRLVPYEKSLYNKVLESRSESSCLTDGQYVKKMAGRFFQQNRPLNSNHTFNRWLEALDHVSRDDRAFCWLRPNHGDELTDIEQLLSWFVSFLDAVVNSACPYLANTGNLLNDYYDLKLSESEKAYCFIIMSSWHKGFECGDSFFPLEDHPGTMLDLEKCVKPIHKEVVSWTVESKKKMAHLTNLFVLALFDLEDSYQNKIQTVEHSSDLSGTRRNPIPSVS